MHGWRHVDTARCTQCGVYTPAEDLLITPAGRLFCTTCGVSGQDEAPARPAADDGELAWIGAPLRPELGRHARVAALLMVLGAVLFPLAAWVSQL
jgi:hypothetical protein